MPSDLLNLPFGLVVDGFLSFIQSRFSNPEITPPAYRWNPDETQSRIRISSTYVIDNAKSGGIPSITVRRSGLQFASRVMDNLASADANVLTNAQYEDWADGTIDMLCEAGSASEASSLANFLAIEIQANRKGIKYTLPFIRYISWADVGPETPVEQNVEVRRWQVFLRIKISVYLGWIKKEIDLTPFNKISITNISSDNTWESDTGIITPGQPYIVDNTADFGIFRINKPQLLVSELQKKWYYVLMEDNNRLYIIEEIINNHQIRLSDKDERNIVVPYNPSESKNINYKIVWNTIHLKVEIPKA